jgi:two-component system, LytTR family, response regulator
MKIRCLAVDDEPLALELLEDNISKLPFLQLVGSCNSAIEAMKFVQDQSIDLIFLDIQMPGITGLQFIKSMTHPPMIILVTAYEKHALEAFGLNVVDYLVKPSSFERFVKACNKAWDLFQLKSKQNQPIIEPELDYFFVNVDYSLVKILFSDIAYMEGLKDYIKIHLKNTTKAIITRMPMKSMEILLPSKKFMRIHKSYIISVAAINMIKKNAVYIGNTELPISENYKDSLMQVIVKAS